MINNNNFCSITALNYYYCTIIKTHSFSLTNRFTSLATSHPPTKPKNPSLSQGSGVEGRLCTRFRGANVRTAFRKFASTLEIINQPVNTLARPRQAPLPPGPLSVTRVRARVVNACTWATRRARSTVNYALRPRVHRHPVNLHQTSTVCCVALLLHLVILSLSLVFFLAHTWSTLTCKDACMSLDRCFVFSFFFFFACSSFFMVLTLWIIFFFFFSHKFRVYYRRFNF